MPLCLRTLEWGWRLALGVPAIIRYGKGLYSCIQCSIYRRNRQSSYLAGRRILFVALRGQFSVAAFADLDPSVFIPHFVHYLDNKGERSCRIITRIPYARRFGPQMRFNTK